MCTHVLVNQLLYSSYSGSPEGEYFLRAPLCLVADVEASKDSRRRVHLAQLLAAFERPPAQRPFYTAEERSLSVLRGVLSLEPSVSAQRIAASSDALLVRSRRLLELYEPLVRIHSHFFISLHQQLLLPVISPLFLLVLEECKLELFMRRR